MKNKIVLGLMCCIALQIPVFAAEVLPNVIPQAGSINNHDLEIIKRQQIEQQIQEDYKRFEKRKKEDKVDKKERKQKGKVEKARIEEYATKGVYVENIEVSPSQILTNEEIKSIISEYAQNNLTVEQIQEVVDKINQLYIKKGFVTARAYLPEQTIENEVVKIELLEGKVGEVTLEGNKWTKKEYIDTRLNLKQGEIFNIQALEQSLLNFNRYNDGIELNGTLFPGQKELGTTDVKVKVEEKLPFRVTALMDNAGRDSIGHYRGGLMLQDDSLFGYRDKLTLGAYANRYSVTPFADYNIPVNKKDGRIGFSYSSSNTKIGHGPFRIFNIKSRSQNYSLYYTQPLYRRPWTELSSTTSISYKRAVTSFDGYDLSKDNITTAQTGLYFRYDTRRGIWYLNQNISYSFPIFDNDSNYLKLDGGIFRLHDFGHGFVGTLRGNYQVIPNKEVVPAIDQFIAGGLATVRGYSEGLLIGRNGYLISAELMFPIGPRSILSRDKSKRIPFSGNYLKCFLFADHAGVFPYKGTGLGEGVYDQNDFLMSLGVGFKVDLPKDIGLRLAWGFPVMRNNHEEVSRCGRFHIELSLTPDFDALVKMRHPKNGEVVRNEEAFKFANNKETKLIKRTTIKSLASKNKKHMLIGKH